MSQPPGRATSQTLHLGSYVHNLQGDSGPGSHVYSLKCHPSSYTLHVESHIHNLQGYTLPDHAPGITCSVFMVSLKGDPAPKTQYLGSHTHSVHGDLLPDPAPRVRHPQSLQRPPSRPYIWDHMPTVHRVTPSLRPCTCCHMSTVPRVTAPPKPVPEVKGPSSPG